MGALGGGFQLPGAAAVRDSMSAQGPAATDTDSEPDEGADQSHMYGDDGQEAAYDGAAGGEEAGKEEGASAAWRPPPPSREDQADGAQEDEEEDEGGYVGELPDTPAAPAKEMKRHTSLAQVELVEARANETWHWIDDEEMVFMPAKLVPAKLAGPPQYVRRTTTARTNTTARRDPASRL